MPIRPLKNDGFLLEHLFDSEGFPPSVGAAPLPSAGHLLWGPGATGPYGRYRILPLVTSDWTEDSQSLLLFGIWTEGQVFSVADSLEK